MREAICCLSLPAFSFACVLVCRVEKQQQQRSGACERGEECASREGGRRAATVVGATLDTHAFCSAACLSVFHSLVLLSSRSSRPIIISYSYAVWRVKDESATVSLIVVLGNVKTRTSPASLY